MATETNTGELYSTVIEQRRDGKKFTDNEGNTSFIGKQGLITGLGILSTEKNHLTSLGLSFQEKNGNFHLTFVVADPTLYYQAINQHPTHLSGMIEPDITTNRKKLVKTRFALTKGNSRPVIAISMTLTPNGNITDSSVDTAVFQNTKSIQQNEFDSSVPVELGNILKRTWQKRCEERGNLPLSVINNSLFDIIQSLANDQVVDYIVENGLTVLFENKGIEIINPVTSKKETVYFRKDALSVLGLYTETGEQKRAFNFHHIPSKSVFSTNPLDKMTNGGLSVHITDPLTNWVSTMTLYRLSMALDYRKFTNTSPTPLGDIDAINRTARSVSAMIETENKKKKRGRDTEKLFHFLRSLDTNNNLEEIDQQDLAYLMMAFTHHADDIEKFVSQIITSSSPGRPIRKKKTRKKKTNQSEENNLDLATQVTEQRASKLQDSFQTNLIAQEKSFTIKQEKDRLAANLLTEVYKRLNKTRIPDINLLIASLFYNPDVLPHKNTVHDIAFQRVKQNSLAQQVISQAVEQYGLFEQIYYLERHHDRTNIQAVAMKPFIIKSGETLSLRRVPFVIAEQKDNPQEISALALIKATHNKELVLAAESTIAWSQLTERKKVTQYQLYLKRQRQKLDEYKNRLEQQKIKQRAAAKQRRKEAEQHKREQENPFLKDGPFDTALNQRPYHTAITIDAPKVRSPEQALSAEITPDGFIVRLFIVDAELIEREIDAQLPATATNEQRQSLRSRLQPKAVLVEKKRKPAIAYTFIFKDGDKQGRIPLTDFKIEPTVVHVQNAYQAQTTSNGKSLHETLNKGNGSDPILNNLYRFYRKQHKPLRNNKRTVSIGDRMSTFFIEYLTSLAATQLAKKDEDFPIIYRNREGYYRDYLGELFRFYSYDDLTDYLPHSSRLKKKHDRVFYTSFHPAEYGLTPKGDPIHSSETGGVYARFTAPFRRKDDFYNALAIIYCFIYKKPVPAHIIKAMRQVAQDKTLNSQTKHKDKDHQQQEKPGYMGLLVHQSIMQGNGIENLDDDSLRYLIRYYHDVEQHDESISFSDNSEQKNALIQHIKTRITSEKTNAEKMALLATAWLFPIIKDQDMKTVHEEAYKTISRHNRAWDIMTLAIEKHHFADEFYFEKHQRKREQDGRMEYAYRPVWVKGGVEKTIGVKDLIFHAHKEKHSLRNRGIGAFLTALKNDNIVTTPHNEHEQSVSVPSTKPFSEKGPYQEALSKRPLKEQGVAISYNILNAQNAFSAEKTEKGFQIKFFVPDIALVEQEIQHQLETSDLPFEESTLRKELHAESYFTQNQTKPAIIYTYDFNNDGTTTIDIKEGLVSLSRAYTPSSTSISRIANNNQTSGDKDLSILCEFCREHQQVNMTVDPKFFRKDELGSRLINFLINRLTLEISHILKDNSSVGLQLIHTEQPQTFQVYGAETPYEGEQSLKEHSVSPIGVEKQNTLYRITSHPLGYTINPQSHVSHVPFTDPLSNQVSFINNMLIYTAMVAKTKPSYKVLNKAQTLAQTLTQVNQALHDRCDYNPEQDSLVTTGQALYQKIQNGDNLKEASVTNLRGFLFYCHQTEKQGNAISLSNDQKTVIYSTINASIKKVEKEPDEIAFLTTVLFCPIQITRNLRKMALEKLYNQKSLWESLRIAIRDHNYADEFYFEFIKYQVNGNPSYAYRPVWVKGGVEKIIPDHALIYSPHITEKILMNNALKTFFTKTEFPKKNSYVITTRRLEAS